MTKARIAVAMSGGVDSSVAALILKESGCEILGFSMELWNQRESDSDGNARRSMESFCDARAVAARLNIPHRVIDLRKEFERIVVRAFVESYRSGLTPSPCVLCNSRMKFSRLSLLAEECLASRIATGHYARVFHDEASGRRLLFQSLDKRKDQSYFLFELSQSQLARAVFPLGELNKEQVREMARSRDLPVADKPESQEICFVPDGNYAAFVEKYCGPAAKRLKAGLIMDVSGRVLGAHSGIHRYTIGQRRGLGIAYSAPLYVLEILPEENQVVVGERSQLMKTRCRVIRPNWISVDALSAPLRVSAKIRSRHPKSPATIHPVEGGGVEVVFDNPQPAISPGQACVFYDGEKVVGGGWIDRN